MLHIVTGPMMSGKSRRVIELRDLHRSAGKSVRMYLPSVSESSKVTTRDPSVADVTATIITVDMATGLSQESPFDSRSLQKVIEFLENPAAVAIFDEVQFLGAKALDTLVGSRTLGSGTLVLAGLLEDSEGKPFGSLHSVLGKASRVEFLKAVCESCYRPACRTACAAAKSEQVLVNKHSYYPLCEPCFEHHVAAKRRSIDDLSYLAPRFFYS